MSPTISIWVRCHRHAAIVHRLVKLVAPYADEVVVAFEVGMPKAEVALLAAGRPDRLVGLPRLSVIERAEAWVNAQCRGDWTLRLDYDEVPSPALLRELRPLISAPDVIGYRVPRLWAWPDSERFLAQRPWWPDHQPRLLRRDPTRVQFPSLTHEMTRLAGPERTLELPIYHLDLALNPLPDRIAKAKLYAGQRAMPDILGEPFNDAYYLPEHRRDPPLALPIPAEDRTAIAGVLAGFDPPRARLPRRIVTAREKDIAAALRGRRSRRRPRLPRAPRRTSALSQLPYVPTPEPGEVSLDYRARLEVVDHDRRFAPLDGRPLHVAIENLSDWTWGWSGGGGAPVLASYRWRARDGAIIVPEGLRTSLAGPLPPGMRTVLPVSVCAPATGEYLLELDLLVEQRQWFGLDVRLPVEVCAL